MKRVLIITYYWPPSGGSGVQRWLKMSKYLPENGWQPVIYTAADAEYPVEDQSLEKDVAPEAEVIRRPIVEPYSFYKKFLGMKKGEKVKAGFINEGTKKSGWKENISVWLRGNLFIPDARCWWVKPSVRYLKKYLNEHPVDAIISTGPPHSMHLIARALHKKFNIPWVADFRDPWTDIDYYKDLKLTRGADKTHHRLERQVLTEATKVVTVGWDCAKGLEKHGAKDVTVITNGYDFDNSMQSNCQNQTSTFTLSHIGIIGANRNPETFWSAIADIVETFPETSLETSPQPSIKIRLIGQVDNSVVESIKRHKIEKYVEIIPYIPHNQVITEQQKSDMLLLFVNNTPNAKGILTGKIFEYMASGRPILCIGPEDGDSARILNETHTGVTVDFDDKEKMKATILDYYHKVNDNQDIATDVNSVAKYSRRNLAKEYAELLNQLTQDTTGESNKPRVLFVASNIPTPKRKSNKVVMEIAHRLSEEYAISVAHPAEIAPFPFNLMKKYRNLAGKNIWFDRDIKVTPLRYIRIFGQKHAFQLLPWYRKKMLKIVQEADIQLVHAHYALPDGYIAYEIHKALGIPYVISFRGSDMKYLQLSNCDTNKKCKETLSNASMIIVHNAAQQELIARAGFQSVLVPHGIEHSFLKPKENQQVNNRITIVSVGELIPQKHIDWVIEAVKNYKGDKDITLNIAGEGPMHHDLEMMAAGADNIHVLGKIPHEEVGKLLEESQIFALPSVNETFGLVYLEATAHQNAVIATQDTGIWGVFDNKNEMFYCDSQETFTEMLYQLIDNDEFRNDMARKAYEKTANNFTWDKIISRYSEIYKSCL